ncbi:hypothetical protein GGR54DRAFT_653163 [Hypoxylon sp. NC1633]|nr:hypothetical protein GGR54DRAFT_653163 [Hypoxylon sp. NC1633]
MLDQDWFICNIDKWRTLNTYSWNFPDMMYCREGIYLARLLTVPDMKYALSPGSEIARARGKNLPSRLVSLPQELFDAITEELSDPSDIANLALTCSYFWRVLQPQTTEAICKLSAPWAGDRIAIVGLLAVGVPQGCEDYEEIQRNSETRDNCWLDENIKEVNPILASISRVDKKQRVEIAHFGAHFGALFQRLATTLYKHPEFKVPGVLRNLTKGEYILDSTLSAHTHPATNLGEVIMLLAQWSEDLGDSGGWVDWAGDRLDIRSIEYIDDDWADVTDILLHDITGTSHHYIQIAPDGDREVCELGDCETGRVWVD